MMLFVLKRVSGIINYFKLKISPMPAYEPLLHSPLS